MAKIPRFKTDEEIAEFWDTHSLADFEDELEIAADAVFVKPERQVISLRLDRKIVKALKSLAAQKGIGYSPFSECGSWKGFTILRKTDWPCVAAR